MRSFYLVLLILSLQLLADPIDPIESNIDSIFRLRVSEIQIQVRRLADCHDEACFLIRLDSCIKLQNELNEFCDKVYYNDKNNFTAEFIVTKRVREGTETMIALDWVPINRWAQTTEGLLDDHVLELLMLLYPYGGYFENECPSWSRSASSLSESSTLGDGAYVYFLKKLNSIGPHDYTIVSSLHEFLMRELTNVCCFEYSKRKVRSELRALLKTESKFPRQTETIQAAINGLNDIPKRNFKLKGKTIFN